MNDQDEKEFMRRLTLVNNPYRSSGREPDPPPPWVILLQVRDVPHFYHEKVVDDDGCNLIAWEENDEPAAIAAITQGIKQGFFRVDSIFIPMSNVICILPKVSTRSR